MCAMPCAPLVPRFRSYKLILSNSFANSLTNLVSIHGLIPWLKAVLSSVQTKSIAKIPVPATVQIERQFLSVYQSFLDRLEGSRYSRNAILMSRFERRVCMQKQFIGRVGKPCVNLYQATYSTTSPSGKWSHATIMIHSFSSFEIDGSLWCNLRAAVSMLQPASASLQRSLQACLFPCQMIK